MADKKSYEIMLILTPENTETKNKKIIEGIKKQMKSFGGEVTHEDIWGLRDLAYKIKKYETAFYVILYFQFPGDQLLELQDFLRLEGDVFRFMITVPPLDYAPIDYATMLKEDEELAEQKKVVIEQTPKPFHSKPAPKPVEKEKPVEEAKPVEKISDEEKKKQTEKLENVLDKKIAESDDAAEAPVKKSSKKAEDVDTNLEDKLRRIIEGDSL